MNRRKALGQHFLKNIHVLRKIVLTIRPQENDFLIEIGAGKGALTFLLAAKAGKVIAIERDRSFIPFLQRKGFTNLIILEEDILKVEFKELVEKKYKGKVKLVGNLPYSISSPLLFKILGERELFSECIFLFQKELAERICAKPGTKKYAPLSILLQIYFSTKLHFFVSPDSFLPPPRVQSALVSFKRRNKPLFLVPREEAFRKFLKGTFRHRRKYLFNNLIRLNYPSSSLKEAFQKFNLAVSLRPEQLTISQFVSLFKFLTENQKKGSDDKHQQ